MVSNYTLSTYEILQSTNPLPFLLLFSVTVILQFTKCALNFKPM